MSYLIGGIKLQIAKEKQAMHSGTMDKWFDDGNLQFYLRDDRMVVNNTG